MSEKAAPDYKDVQELVDNFRKLLDAIAEGNIDLLLRIMRSWQVRTQKRCEEIGGSFEDMLLSTVNELVKTEWGAYSLEAFSSYGDELNDYAEAITAGGVLPEQAADMIRNAWSDGFRRGLVCAMSGKSIIAINQELERRCSKRDT